jgi:uncharacterized protein with HEPN domain
MRHDDSTLLDIWIAAVRIEESTKDIDLDQFRSDWKIHSAVLHQLMIIVEAVKRLSENFRNSHPEIPWKSIAGLRDVLIHHYDFIDLSEVWTISEKHIPILIDFLKDQIPKR